MGEFNGNIRTLGQTGLSLLPIEESYAIVMGFATTETGITVGAPVKLKSDGTVGAIAASTDKPIGIVASAYSKTDATIRVYTPFVAKIQGALASGTVAAGDDVAALGPDSTTGLPKFKTAASGDYICGQALVGNTAGLAINVGYLRVPRLKA